MTALILTKPSKEVAWLVSKRPHQISGSYIWDTSARLFQGHWSGLKHASVTVTYLWILTSWRDNFFEDWLLMLYGQKLFWINNNPHLTFPMDNASTLGVSKGVVSKRWWSTISIHHVWQDYFIFFCRLLW